MGAEIQDGAILVARAILNSSLWTMSFADRIVAITCICLACWKKKKWFDGKRQIVIERGQFVRGRRKLAKECGMTEDQLRCSLRRLESAGFVTLKVTPHYTLFEIPKYSHYQDLTKYSDKLDLDIDPGFDPGVTPESPHAHPGVTPESPTYKKDNNGEEREEEGAATAAPLPPSLQALEDGLRTRPESPGQDPIFKHLWDLARRQNVNAKEDTLRRYLKGWIAQKGAQAVEEILMRQDVVGKSVTAIQDYFFNSMKKKGFV